MAAVATGGVAGAVGGDVARVVAWSAAFHVALRGYLARGGRDVFRIVAGLGLAAAACHVGWCAMHAVDLDAAARHLATPSGFSVSFAPIGPWLVAPRGSRRVLFLARALGSLPPAVATARLGCVAAGCCGGGAHPTQLYEIAGCGALAVAAARAPMRLAAPIAVAGLAAIRLAVEPLRAPSPDGAATVSAQVVAAALLVVGGAAVVAALRPSVRGACRGEAA